VLAAVKLKTAHNTKLGVTILVSPKGLALYHMTAETGKKIVCTGQCLQFWPPLLIKKGKKPTGVAGLNAKKLGTIKRPDGRYQVTYAGFALYTFAGDKKAGQVNGQGVEKIWFVITPAGKVFKKAV
jgi:predicted lipoprotein with Yx(FWY)xxD motif